VSVRLVYLHLRAVGSATVEQLVADLGLTPPPIYDARDTLQNHDLLTVVSDPEDGRRHRYALNGAAGGEAQLDANATLTDENPAETVGREPSRR
jgi:DNA-binding MarR family transcriptional regulator